jgi:hypothetical protein
LRRERRQSPRPAADAEVASAKAALLRIRIEEKQLTMVRQSDVNELTDSLCGVMLIELSSLTARSVRLSRQGRRGGQISSYGRARRFSAPRAA